MFEDIRKAPREGGLRGGGQESVSLLAEHAPDLARDPLGSSGSDLCRADQDDHAHDAGNVGEAVSLKGGEAGGVSSVDGGMGRHSRQTDGSEDESESLFHGFFLFGCLVVIRQDRR